MAKCPTLPEGWHIEAYAAADFPDDLWITVTAANGATVSKLCKEGFERQMARDLMKHADGVHASDEARRERLIANGYKTDSRCTWLAIGRCAECGRVHDGRPHGVLVVDPVATTRVENGYVKVTWHTIPPDGTKLYAHPAGVALPDGGQQ